MKFKYIGDVEGFSFRGIKFPIGESVEVTDEGAISKLENNNHFEKPKTRKTKKESAVSNGDESGNQE